MDAQNAFDKLLALDAAWTRRLNVLSKPGPLRRLAIFFSHSGDSWLLAAGLAALWLLGDPAWKARSLKLAAGMLVVALFVLLIKFSVRRKRPVGEWGQIYRATDPHSFPSGHAARALALAVIALGVGPGWFAGVLWVWAPLVILSRVVMGVHYFSDVVAGALLGAALGGALLFVLP